MFGHSESIPQKDIDDLYRLCSEYIEGRTRQLSHIVSTRGKDALAEFVDGDVARIERELEGELCSMAIGQPPTTKNANIADLGYDQLYDLAKEELDNREVHTETDSWYRRAQNITEAIVQVTFDGEKATLLGCYSLTRDGTNVRLDPPEVFVGDLDLSEQTFGQCASDAIERILALKDIIDAANTIKAKVRVSDTSPTCEVFFEEGGNCAIFALIGYRDHPLIAWGEKNPDRFNNDTSTFETKFKRMPNWK